MAKVCKFQAEKEIQSKDCGETWQDTGVKRKIPGRGPVEKPSYDCGWSDNFLYKWETVEDDYFCNGYDKYTKKKLQVSYNNGVEWEDVDGSEEIGDLLEEFSSDCCYIRVSTSESGFCSCDWKKVSGRIEEASLDEELWVYTGRYFIDEVIDDFSFDCFESAGLCTVVQYTDGTNHSPDKETYIQGDLIKYIYYNCYEELIVPDGQPAYKDTLEKLYFGNDFEQDYIKGSYGGCTGLTDIIGLENTHITEMNALFGGCTSLTAVTLPTTCKAISQPSGSGEHYLSGFPSSGIKSINLENVTNGISDSAFTDCKSLTAVTLPNPIVTYDNQVGEGIFSECTSLESVVIPPKYFVGISMFAGCTSLSSVTFEGDSRIKRWGFSGCTSLTRVDNLISNIGGGAFYNCTGLTELTIEPYIGLNGYGQGNLGIIYDGNYVPYGAFEGCSSLTGIIFKNTEPPIFEGAWSSNPEHYQHMFANTNNCPIYVPPQSVDTYKAANGWSLFENRIQGISNYDPDLTYKGILKYSDSTAYQIPNIYKQFEMSSADTKDNEYDESTMISAEINGKTVSRIMSDSFSYLSSLTSVTITSGVTYIGAAFVNCFSLNNAELPETVTLIAMDAFYNCRSLTSVTIHATTPPYLEYHPAHGTGFAGNSPIYVPASAVDIYKTAENWSSYADRIQPIP